MRGWRKGTPVTVRVMSGAWVPYSAEMAVDLIDWPLEQVHEVFGDTVLIRQTLGGLEFGRPDPAPDSDETRAEVAEIIERGMVGAEEQHRLFCGGPRRLPDPDQLHRDLIAARDGAWSQ